MTRRCTPRILAAMFERVRFSRYAWRFERAFKTDDWEPVKECFHPDARYFIVGGPPDIAETHGADNIIRLFQRMLNEIDRKYDKRSPRLSGWPRLRDGELSLHWSVKYTLGERSTVLTGESRCRFDGAKIIELRDTMPPDEIARWRAMVA